MFYALLRELQKRCGQGVTARDLADSISAASASVVREGYLADVKESLGDVLQGLGGHWPECGEAEVVRRATERLADASVRARGGSRKGAA